MTWARSFARRWLLRLALVLLVSAAVVFARAVAIGSTPRDPRLDG